MNALSGKTLILWIAATIGWLAFTAVLDNLGVPVLLLLLLHILVASIVLFRIARNTMVDQGSAFLSPIREGPTALTPHGAAAAWISGFGTIGVVAAILMHGPVAYALIGGIVGGMVLTQTVLAPAFADSGARSLTHWAEWRFGGTAGRIAVFLLALTGITILTLQFGFVVLLADAVLGVSAWLLLPLIAILVLLAILPGGLATMIPAQAALYLILFVGIFVPAFWLGMSKTGIILPYVAPGALLHEIATAEDKLGLSREADTLVATLLGLTALFGTLALPHTLVRWPAERDGTEARWFAQRGTVLVILVLAAIPLFAIAVRADQLFAVLVNGTPLPSNETPAVALANSMATLNPPEWLIAALGIGALAAIVATCASATFLVTTTTGIDPERETIGGHLSRCRWIGTAAVTFAMALALFVPFDPLAGFLGLMTLAASAGLAPLFLGLFWFRMTARGALAGLVAGALTCAILFGFGLSVMDGVALIGLAISTLASVIASLMPGEPKLSPPVTSPPKR